MSAAGVIPVNEPGWLAGLPAKLPAVFLPNPKAAERFFGFFTAIIHSENTRRAYYKASCRFSDWCEWKGLGLGTVKAPHLASALKPWRHAHNAALRPAHGCRLAR